MTIPTEPIGIVLRSRVLQEAMRDFAEGSISAEKMQSSIRRGGMRDHWAGCFDNGAYNVQIDCTEGRLAVKLDPPKDLLQQFIELNR